MAKYNLGCGTQKFSGFDGVDIQDFGQKYVTDIWTFIYEMAEPNHCEGIRTHHFLEHFNNTDVVAIINWAHSVLSTNSEFYIEVPHKDKEESWVLTHESYWTESTFKMLADDRKINDYLGFGRWEIKQLVTNNRKDIHCILKPIKNE